MSAHMSMLFEIFRYTRFWVDNVSLYLRLWIFLNPIICFIPCVGVYLFVLSYHGKIITSTLSTYFIFILLKPSIIKSKLNFIFQFFTISISILITIGKIRYFRIGDNFWAVVISNTNSIILCLLITVFGDYIFKWL